MKYEKMIQSILKEVGGQENIENVYHCATRLRFQLKDETKANDEAVKAIDGVLSIVKGGGQYQIVIGQHVADVYNELQTMMGTTENEIELKDAKEFKQEMKKKKISNQFIDVISGVFTPVLGMLTATGVIKGLLAFLAATGDALYTLFSGTIFQTDVYVEFLGIPVLLMNYASSVIPVILTCYFAAKIEKFFAKRISDLFKTFAVPALTLLISIILAFLIIGPIATFASDLLGAAFTALFNLNATISGFLYGALIQVCVMFGVHWGFVAISVNNLATLGYDPITIAGLASAFGQAGVVLMIMLRTKNKKLKSVCGPAIISAMVGITEPSIYGVTLQFKKPFMLACLASGIGGAIIGFGGVKQYVYGTNGIFGWLQVINPQTGFDSSVLAAIIACAVSFIAAIILMMTVGKDSIPESK